MTDDRRLCVRPEQLAGRFLHLLSRHESRDYAGLVRGIGSTAGSHFRRAIQKYLDAGVLFGLITDTGEGARLTFRGYELLQGYAVPDDEKPRRTVPGMLGMSGPHSVPTDPPQIARAIGAAFLTEPFPRRVRESLFLTRRAASREAVEARLATLGIGSETDIWLGWAEAARIVKVSSWDISPREGSMCPEIVDLYSEAELSAIEQTVYRQLTSYQFDDEHSKHPWCYRELGKAFKTFDKIKPDKAEVPMLDAVGGVLMALGFQCQWRNGPREDAETQPDTTMLEFGKQGDDLGVFFLRAPLLEREDCAGYIIAAELKRKRADKKGVGQAMMFAGRLQNFWTQQGVTVRVIPVVISDSDCYSGKPGKDYAYDNSILHLPMRTLQGLLEKQGDRFCSGQSLITPPYILGALFRFREECHFEPSVEDILEAVDGLLAPDAA